MFPVADMQGRVSAFSGRALSEKDEAKYLNSPETLVFKKNNILFGIPEARSAIRKAGVAFLAEGHLDVCTLHQYGYTMTLGVQGTAFTESQCRFFKKTLQSFGHCI